MFFRPPQILPGLAASAIPLLSASVAGALPGDIETTFAAPPAGTTSMEVLDIDTSGRVLALAKISNSDRRLLRYLANGLLDAPFTEPAPLKNRTRAAAFLGDNTIIAAGNYNISGSPTGAVHLFAGGTLDPAFSLETTDTLVTNQVHVIPGDRFWLAGNFFNDFLEGSFVASHKADGSLIDRPFINREAEIRHSLVEPDGNLVYAARFNGDRTLHRLAPDGSGAPAFPTTFPELEYLNVLRRETNGNFLAGGYLRNFPAPDITQLARHDTTTASDLALVGDATGRIEQLAADSAGRILATGITMLGPIDLSAQPLVRLLPDGALDFNFHASFPGLGAAVSKVTSVRVLPGGSILTGLELANGTGALVQLAGGDPPPTAPAVAFLSPGLEARQFQDLTLQVWASGFPVPTVQWQKDGAAIPGATGNLLTIAAIDPTDAGSYTAVLTNANDSIVSPPVVVTVRGPLPGDIDTRSLSALEAGSLWKLLPRPDGRLLALGSVRANGTFRQVVQLEPDGSVDPGFTVPSFDTPAFTAYLTDMALAPDGSILVTYELSEDNGFEVFYPVVRLHPDGSFDRTLAVPDCCQSSFLVTLADGSLLADWDFNPRWFNATGNAIASVDMADSYHQSPADALVVYAGQPADYPSGPGLYEIDAGGNRDAATYIPLPDGLDHLRILPDGSIRALRLDTGTWRAAKFAANGTAIGELDISLAAILAADFSDDGTSRIYGTRDNTGTTVHEVVRITPDLTSAQTVMQGSDLVTLTTATGFLFAPDDSLWAYGNLPPLNGFTSVGLARFFTGFQVPGAPAFDLLPSVQTIEGGDHLQLRAVSHSWPRPIFEWQFNGTPITGATGPGIYLPQTDFSDAGLYEAIITNELGSAGSPPVAVHVRNGFTLESIGPVGSRRFRLPTVDGRHYRLERNSGLSPASWQSIDSLPGAGSVWEPSDATAGSAYHYRARVER